MQVLFGHAKINSAVRYLSVKANDAIETVEKIGHLGSVTSTSDSGRRQWCKSHCP